MTSRFAKDAAEIVLRKFRDGQLDRRGFLAALGALGLSVALRPGTAHAAENEIVLCNWGGTAVDAFQKAYGIPFTAKTGMKLVIDGAGPSNGAIRTMVQNGNVIWDVADSSLVDGKGLGGAGFLTPIDYSVIDRKKVMEGYAQDYAIANYTFANILAYNREKTKADLTSWADFLDFDKYPGKRTMCKWVDGQLEPILLADGVKPEDLYPLDVDRALKKLEPYLKEFIFWDGGAQSQQLFRDGEVVMGNIWHTRAKLLRDENPNMTWTWNQNLLFCGAWVVPKNNPSGKKVFDFINAALEPQAQIDLMRIMGNGPTNPAAEALMTDADRKLSPTSPANTKGQVLVSSDYYGTHEAELQNRFLDFISG